MKSARILVLLTVVSMLAGCIAVLAAGGATAGVLFVKGVAKKNYPHGVERTYNAALATLDDNGVTVFERKVDATGGRIEGRLADDKKIKMTFQAVGENVTEVSLRIGTWGDKERSNYLFVQLDKRMR